MQVEVRVETLLLPQVTCIILHHTPWTDFESVIPKKDERSVSADNGRCRWKHLVVTFSRIHCFVLAPICLWYGKMKIDL